MIYAFFMRQHTARKLFLFGRYSLALLLPKKWLRTLGVGRGETVQLELDRKRRRIVVRLNSARTPPETTTKPGVKPPSSSEKSDLEPIPPL